MNMLLLRGVDERIEIPRADRRYEHIVKILKKTPGDSLEAGRTDGSLGVAILESIGDKVLILKFVPQDSAPPLRRLRILMGFPRPIQAGRILKDLSSIGVFSIWFCLSALGDKSYANSRFFKEKDFEDPLVEGAEQGGNPLLPEVRTFWSLDAALDALAEDEKTESWTKIGCHPGAGSFKLSEADRVEEPCVLALGSERGWTEQEVSRLKDRGFDIRNMGDRILKTETAVTVSVAIVLSKLGYM
ncbi:MAG: ribosomal RNA small subunit methyltransferase E [Spirochaetes bacterium]|nr:MAG: ribosomal RNA small subunit methyltransferase E [Spirochaetota bacterium]